MKSSTTLCESDNPWKNTIDHLLVEFGYTADCFKTPKQAIDRLIQWNIDIATDPAVNGNRVLVDRKDIQLWRAEWLEGYETEDDVDVVTPFDHYLY